MKNTRSSVPPAPAAKERGPGLVKAGSRNQFGKKPDSDRNRLALAELMARQPLPGSFSDTYPETTDADCEGRCDCWGDANPRLTKEERKEVEAHLASLKGPYDLGN